MNGKVDRDPFTWKAGLEIVGLAVVFFLIVFGMMSLSACSILPPLEVCYEHPDYGRVCIVLRGDVVEKATAPDGSAVPESVRAEIEAKLRVK